MTATIATLQADLAAVQGGIAVPGATDASTPAYAALRAALSQTQADLTVGFASVEGYINWLAVYGATGDGMFAFDTAANGVTALNAAAGLTAYLATVAQVSGYVGRIARNLLNAGP